MKTLQEALFSRRNISSNAKFQDIVKYIKSFESSYEQTGPIIFIIENIHSTRLDSKQAFIIANCDWDVNNIISALNKNGINSTFSLLNYRSLMNSYGFIIISIHNDLKDMYATPFNPTDISDLKDCRIIAHEYIGDPEDVKEMGIMLESFIRPELLKK